MPITRESHHHLFTHLLVLVPIMVDIVCTILQDFIFIILIPFIPSTLPYWYLIYDIYTDVMYMHHTQNALYLCPDTKYPLIVYTTSGISNNYL